MSERQFNLFSQLASEEHWHSTPIVVAITKAAYDEILRLRAELAAIHAHEQAKALVQE